MSGLLYQINENKCQGWNKPSSLFFGPYISNLSGYYSPAGSTTLVSIAGSNFCSYSVVRFATYSPTVYFINSNNLQFYIPSTINSGIFPIQVFTGSIGSNIVDYTIDNASGYWLLNTSGGINNTNTANSSLVSMSSISRGAPVTITYSENSSYSVPNNVNWIICDTTDGPINIILPLGSQYTGREIMFKNPTGSNNVITNSNIIIPLDKLSGTPTDEILPAILGAWATLVFDGTFWITMQANFTAS